MLTTRYLAIILCFTACGALAQSAAPAPVTPAAAPAANAPINTGMASPSNATKTAPSATPAAAPANVAPPAPLPTTTAATATTPAPSATPTSVAQSGTKTIICPPIEKLIKKELFWGAPGGWRSYSQSFVNTIESFSGAQWVGVEVGKMLCVYKGKESFDFPVVLQNDTLTPAPKGNKWISQRGGYVNCLSSIVDECPFQVKEEKQDMQEIYKGLEFKKNQPADSSQ